MDLIPKFLLTADVLPFISLILLTANWKPFTSWVLRLAARLLFVINIFLLAGNQFLTGSGILESARLLRLFNLWPLNDQLLLFLRRGRNLGIDVCRCLSFQFILELLESLRERLWDSLTPLVIRPRLNRCAKLLYGFLRLKCRDDIPSFEKLEQLFFLRGDRLLTFFKLDLHFFRLIGKPVLCMDALKRRCEGIQHLLVTLHSLLTCLHDCNQAWWYLAHDLFFAKDFLKLCHLACQYFIRIFHQTHKQCLCTFRYTSLLHYFVYQTLLDFLRQIVAF